MNAPNEIERISLLPSAPAVYAMYGGRRAALHVAYVGVAEKLRGRIEQHLERRDSSMTIGVSAAGLNPDQVTELKWWTDAQFSDRVALEAAELVAFEILDPALRSRGRVQGAARQLATDPTFHDRMAALFAGTPAGRLVLPTLQDALDRVARLEHRLQLLEERLTMLGKEPPS